MKTLECVEINRKNRKKYLQVEIIHAMLFKLRQDFSFGSNFHTSYCLRLKVIFSPIYF